MGLNGRHFGVWNYAENPMALERMCHELPILPREVAATFFDEAEAVTEDSRDPREAGSAGLFGSVPSTLAASDRQDFDASWEPQAGNVAAGVLMVETYDPVIPTLVCVTRVSEDCFLSRVFSGDDVQAVKALRESPAKGGVI